jgi:hypothetical protein
MLKCNFMDGEHGGKIPIKTQYYSYGPGRGTGTFVIGGQPLDDKPSYLCMIPSAWSVRT